MAKRKTFEEPTPTPSIDVKEYEAEVYNAYNTYRGISTSKDHKKWVTEYVAGLKKDPMIYSHGKTKDYSPFGIWARMLHRGISIPETEKKVFDEFLIRLENKYSDYLKSKKKSIEERTKKFADTLCKHLVDINIFIDECSTLILKKKKKDIDVKKTCDKFEITPAFYTEVIHFIEDKLNELYLARDKKDDQLVEGYSYFTKSQLVSYIETQEELLNYYNSKIQEKRQSRKPRKKKIKTPQQIASKVKYLPSFNGINSMKPEQIVGCSSVVVLNVKTKSITVYKAKANETFSFKGTTLLGVDEEKSTIKKIRGFDKFIKINNLNSVNFKYAETLFSSINTKESKPKSRINEHCLFLSSQK